MAIRLNILSKFKWAAALSIAGLAGCAGVQTIPGADRVELIDVRSMPKMEPEFEYDSLGELTAKDGSGCGLFGSTGKEKVVVDDIKNQVAKLGGDAFLIKLWDPPRMRGMCLDNTFTAGGQAVMVWRPHYLEPREKKIEQREVVDVEYDKLWSALVDYVSATDFKIRTYEKESGLLTLEFDATKLQDYADCGVLEFRIASGTVRRSAPYVREHRQRMRFDGQMNLRVRPEGSGRTSVFINARYNLLLQFPTPTVRNARPIPDIAWTFLTNQPATVELQKEQSSDPAAVFRTCQPTYAAEQKILDGIAAIARMSRE